MRVRLWLPHQVLCISGIGQEQPFEVVVRFLCRGAHSLLLNDCFAASKSRVTLPRSGNEAPFACALIWAFSRPFRSGIGHSYDGKSGRFIGYCRQEKRRQEVRSN